MHAHHLQTPLLAGPTSWQASFFSFGDACFGAFDMYWSFGNNLEVDSCCGLTLLGAIPREC